MGTMDVAFFKGGSVAQGEKEEGKGEGVDVGAPRGRGRRKERRGLAWGQQSDWIVRMALGGTIGGSSARSRWGRAGEQGRAVGVGVTNRQY
jgi:hypothetical protein